MARSRTKLDLSAIEALGSSDMVLDDTRARLEPALAWARANSPVVTGEYRDGLAIEEVDVDGARGMALVARSDHSIYVEADEGVLARALDHVEGS